MDRKQRLEGISTGQAVTKDSQSTKDGNVNYSVQDS